MKKTVFAMALVCAVIVAVPFVSTDSDAEVRDQGTAYCYGDNPILVPIYSGDGVWEAHYGDNIPLEVTVDEKGYAHLDLSDVDGVVTVTQTVNTDQAVMRLIPLHLPQSGDEDGRYAVTFYNGTDSLGTQYIESFTTVTYGEDHVFVPGNPFRDGMVFGGWFTDRSCAEEYRFDPTRPIEGDTNVYAKWSSSSSGSGSAGGSGGDVVINGSYIITFETVNGLRYDVTKVTGDSVTFTVTPIDGFEFDAGSIAVGIEGLDAINPNEDGSYTVDNIDSDIVISIWGDAIYSIEYQLSGVGIRVEGYDTPPASTINGGGDAPAFTAQCYESAGFTGMTVSVYMGGTNVTSQYVQDGVITIGDITGDLVIVASAQDTGFPWIYLVLIVLIVAVAAIAIYYIRSKRSGEPGA